MNEQMLFLFGMEQLVSISISLSVGTHCCQKKKKKNLIFCREARNLDSYVKLDCD